MTVLLVLAVILAFGLLAVVAAGAVLGGVGALAGGGISRCRQCHRLGLSLEGKVHPNGCPGSRGRLVPQLVPQLVARLPRGHALPGAADPEGGR